MTFCPVCRLKFDSGNYRMLADHFVDQYRSSDFRHVSWLNRNISKNRMKAVDLSVSLMTFYHISGGIGKWIITDFVRRFRGDCPHPFILAMQQYDPEVIRGYVVEHHHFLKQWIRSCAYVMAKTELEDVQSYELENIMTELHGYGASEPSHHELLIRMGESLGLARNFILTEKPLRQTAEAVKIWNDLAASGSWISTMAAMHSLELIANRDLSNHGAMYPYFNLSILSDSRVPKEVKEFMREGYEADVSHSYVALDLVERHARNEDIEEIQYAYLRSAGAFSDYLEARLERGVMLGNK